LTWRIPLVNINDDCTFIFIVEDFEKNIEML
jgi:hypothetical protein